MRAVVAGWKRWRGSVFGATPTVGRVFIACKQCRRVVPHWRTNRLATEHKPIGCTCGSLSCAYTRLPEWKAAYWVLVRGLLIRKWILRARLWDPRIPYRETA